MHQISMVVPLEVLYTHALIRLKQKKIQHVASLRDQLTGCPLRT